ncbi:MAG: amino acid carrier protein [Eggerthellales bacterium]|nr:amino acid carrier protein [Eggerthellales bacterium]
MDIASVLNQVDAFVWGPPMIILLLSCHIYTTIRTKGIQRKLPLALKMSVTADDAAGDVSNFGAMVTALASTLGTGSIVGVGTAIVAGGPGAILWMWLTGVLGMATKYTEVFASLKYRVKDSEGRMMGGAMHVYTQKFKRADGTVPWWAKFAALWFSVFALFTVFGIGSAVQNSAMTSIIVENFDVSPAIVSGIICISALLIIFGGLKSISKICEALVPFMAGAYIIGCLIILVMNFGYLGDALMLIVQCAFTPQAAFGGAVGSGIMVALQFGCARGLFSNEAGLGTAPIVASAASTKNPARQALAAMTGAFWCTVVVCLLSGLVMVSTLCAHPDLLANGAITNGTQLANAVFGTIPYIGTPILMLGILCFAYSTIIGWGYYGDRLITFLFGRKWVKVYFVLYIAVGFLGGIGVGDIAWTATDIANALMALPNIIMVLFMTGVVAKETDYYVYQGHIDEDAHEEIPTINTK